jgi:hypothetical protein
MGTQGVCLTAAALLPAPRASGKPTPAAARRERGGRWGGSARVWGLSGDTGTRRFVSQLVFCFSCSLKLLYDVALVLPTTA